MLQNEEEKDNKVKIYRQVYWALNKDKLLRNKRNKKSIQQENKEQETIKAKIEEFRLTPIPNLDGQEGLMCAYFGCHKILTPTEKLYGDKCIEHNFKERRPFQ